MKLLLVLGAVVSLNAECALYRIELPENPAAGERTAAAELGRYLPQVVKDRFTVNGNEDVVIHVGDTEAAKKVNLSRAELADEEWVVKSFTRHIVVNGGGSRGVVYAAAHFLEDVFDIHWWSRVEEYVPAAKPAELGKLDLRGRPFFAHREIYTGARDPAMRAANLRIAFLNRQNGGRADNLAAYGGSYRWGEFGGCHTFSYYLDPKVYFEQHPEYYALVDGKRVKCSPISGNLCLSHPDIPKLVWEKMKANILEDEAKSAAEGLVPPKLYDFSMPDGQTVCQCERCREEIARYGNSGQLVRVLNRIAAELKAFRPELLLSTLAYHYNEAPPKGGVIAADNVLIRLCDTSTSMVGSPYSEGNNGLFRNLDGWKPAAKNVSIWDYSICYSFADGLPDCVSCPAPSEKTYPELFRMFAENNVKGVFDEHEGEATADFWELKYFLLNRFLEDPKSDLAALTALFLDRYYGAAAAELGAYRDELGRICRERNGFVDWNPGVAPFNYIHDDDVVRFQALFDRAEKLVEHDAVRLARVRHARSGLDSLVCFRTQAAAKLVYHGPQGPRLDTERIRRRLAAEWTAWSGTRFYDRKVGKVFMATNVVDLTPPKKLALPAEFKGRSCADFYCWDFYKPKAPLCELVDDADSPCEGKAIRIDLVHDTAGYWKSPLFAVGFHNLTGIGVRGMHAIDRKDLKGPGYHWYRFQKGEMPPSQWIYMSRGWGVGTRSDALAMLAGRQAEVWVSLKFTGPEYFAGSNESNAVYIARMLIAE